MRVLGRQLEWQKKELRGDIHFTCISIPGGLLG